GNIRQLLNCIERGKIMSEDHTVHMCDLPREVCDVSPDVQQKGQNDSDDLASIERAKVVDVLRREEGNKTRAAGTLGIDRRKIYRLLEKYGIKDEEVQSGS
ncbi:MAG: helix-turn-helix domain-containing protein, partial [Pirellulaceae bacterium]|nr:helix-turn-helix domain-containing protein [Pirellulaceae bacterium]